MQFTALKKKVIKNYARSKLLRHAECCSLHPPPPHNLLHHHPLAQLLKMQYDFLRTVRRRGPFQQAGLNRWDVVEGKKEKQKARKNKESKKETF